MDLKRLEVLVLDEADRLLEMGFKAELDAIMTRLPKQRRTGTVGASSTWIAILWTMLLCFSIVLPGACCQLAA